MERSTNEVEFYTGPFSLAGQIDYPKGDGPFPVVLIVPGQPQHDRHGNVRGYKAYTNYFEPLTHHLLKAGYAVFRWDKGGTGNSSSGLSAPLNMVSAYKTMVQQDKIDRNKVAILAIGGGSAFVYRKWLELEDINPIYHLCLLSTGVNQLKIEDLNLPIALIAQADNILRSENALLWYAEAKGQPVEIHAAQNVNEQLLDESAGKVNLFNDDKATWSKSSLEFIENWFKQFN